MSQLQQLQETLKSLRLVETAKHLPILIREAEQNDHSFTQFLIDVTGTGGQESRTHIFLQYC
ncbi:hypothetical protein [Sutcliffiella cohnii]|uniref:hypothetical protein n=1 Tax=Sutcliffiella cohnii TaxID=33932 RepID=UPI000833A592|nr:hypothetical protein [Sutcliffiella cohnii]